MVTNNAINLDSAGIAGYDGAGTYTVINSIGNLTVV